MASLFYCDFTLIYFSLVAGLLYRNFGSIILKFGRTFTIVVLTHDFPRLCGAFIIVILANFSSVCGDPVLLRFRFTSCQTCCGSVLLWLQLPCFEAFAVDLEYSHIIGALISMPASGLYYGDFDLRFFSRLRRACSIFFCINYFLACGVMIFLGWLIVSSKKYYVIFGEPPSHSNFS